jgi:mannitol/fructose-specific phosphotransferase system IIA component (Ntr-type)
VIEVLLSELLQPDVVKVPLEATNKWEAIEELVDVLIHAHELRLIDRSRVIEAIFARERSLSTGLEHGLAVPHATVDGIEEIVGGLGVSNRGIPFNSQDGKLACIVVLLVIPREKYQRHVRTLAGIARLASRPDIREKIISARSPDDVMEAVYAFESEAPPGTAGGDPDETAGSP